MKTHWTEEDDDLFATAMMSWIDRYQKRRDKKDISYETLVNIKQFSLNIWLARDSKKELEFLHRSFSRMRGKFIGQEEAAAICSYLLYGDLFCVPPEIKNVMEPVTNRIDVDFRNKNSGS